MQLDTNKETFFEFEILLQSNTLVTKEIDYEYHLNSLKKFMQ